MYMICLINKRLFSVVSITNSHTLPMTLNPKIIGQTTYSIEIKWNSIVACDVYKLQVQNKNKWNNVYWDIKPQCIVRGLDEGWIYTFRLFALRQREDADFEILEQSEPFIATTKQLLKVNLFFMALADSDEDKVRYYITNRSDLLELTNMHGYTPIGYAVHLGNKSIVNILLSAGANIDVGIPLSKKTPLHIAMFNGLNEIAKILIIKKADKSKRDCIGYSWGHHAVNGGNIETVKFYLENGGEIEAKDDGGWTLLIFAIALRSNIALIKLLLDSGADFNAKDRNNFNSFDHARLTEQLEVIELLQKFEKKRNRLKKK